MARRFDLQGEIQMQLILNSPAALWSIVALVLLFTLGGYFIYRFLKYGPK